MAKTSQCTISVSVTGDGIDNDRYSHTSTSVTAPGGGPYPYPLSSGPNTVPVPSGAAKLAIIPPENGSTSITLKGVAGDTGVGLSPYEPSYIRFPDTPPASIVLTAGAAVTVQLFWG